MSPNPTQNNPSRSVRLAWLTLLLTASASVDAANLSEDAGGAIEEIVVTGSHIARDSIYAGRAPVQTITSRQIAAAAAAQPVDILKNLTVNTGSYLATQQNYLQGVSQFSLRGLGLSSTLTLVNGRRPGIAPVSNGAGHSFFDINTLPVTMIERVEILRDGASATYGSQAVAGVANIITRQVDGFELTGGYRHASNDAWDLGFATGLRTERANASLHGAYYRQDENFRTDFDWMIDRAIDPDGDGDIVEGSFDSGRGSPGSFRRAVANADGTFSPFKVPGGGNSPRTPDPDCRAGGGFPSGSLCRMDFSDQRTMIAAEERAQFFAEAGFTLTDGLLLFAELGYSANTVTDRVGNLLLFNGNVEGTNEFFVPASHPFNFWTDDDGDGRLTYVQPDAWDPARHEAVDVGYFGRPLGAEANGDHAADERRDFDNLRAVLGADYDLGDTWTATAYFSHAQSDFDLRSGHHWVAAEFARAILEGVWNPFGTRLVAPNLTTPKTVADDRLDPALANQRAGNAPAVFERFNSTKVETAETEQQVLEAVATGRLFDWRGGSAELAVGAQGRRLAYAQRPDPLNASGGGPQAIRQFPADAKQKVWAVFAENVIPFGDRSEVQLALRHEEYDQAGATTDPKIAALFAATDWLALRGSWGTSFQAPSVFQSAGNTTSRTLSDPFRFDAQGNGECTVDAAGNIVNRGDNFIAVTVLKGGELKPQSADLVNVGALIQPMRAATLSIDYWAIDYQDVIAQGRGFQSILDQDCRDDGRPNNPRVQRDSSGQLSVVATDYENIARVRGAGLDLNARLQLDSAYGDWQLEAAASLLTRFDVNTGLGAQDQLGSRNDANGFGPTPEWRFNLSLTWQRGPSLANLTLRHIDSYRNDEVATLPKIDAWTVVDAHYAQRIGRATVALGANNLADKDPPPLPSGRLGSQRYNLRPGFDGFVHDIRGRTLYLRFRYRI